jgi:hypothetical protein
MAYPTRHFFLRHPHSMDADPHQSHQQNEYGNGQWAMGRRGRLQHGWAQYNTTPMHEHKGYDFEAPPVMPIKVCLHHPGPPLPIPATSISMTVTLVMTTGGSTPRRTLTDVACVSIMRAILALSRPRLVVRLQHSILRQFSSCVDEVCRWRDKSRPAEPAGRLLELACSPSLRRPIPWPKMLFM